MYLGIACELRGQGLQLFAGRLLVVGGGEELQCTRQPAVPRRRGAFDAAEVGYGLTRVPSKPPHVQYQAVRTTKLFTNVVVRLPDVRQ